MSLPGGEAEPGLSLPSSHWCPRCLMHNRALDSYNNTFTYRRLCPVCMDKERRGELPTIDVPDLPNGERAAYDLLVDEPIAEKTRQARTGGSAALPAPRADYA